MLSLAGPAPYDSEGLPRIFVCQATLDRLERLVNDAVQRGRMLPDRLLHELSRASMVAPGKLPSNVVAIGRLVSFRDGAGQERTVTLAFPEHADASRQRLSVATPLGVALLGLAEGDTYHWDEGTSQRHSVTVIRVESDPDLEG